MKTLTIFDTNLDTELEIYLGENAKDNWDILDKSSQNDIWFHLENHPSPHVILKIPDNGKNINKQTILYCAMICKENSKFSGHKKISVIYTEKKNVSKGQDVGSVYTKKTNKVVI